MERELITLPQSISILPSTVTVAVVPNYTLVLESESSYHLHTGNPFANCIARVPHYGQQHESYHASFCPGLTLVIRLVSLDKVLNSTEIF